MFNTSWIKDQNTTENELWTRWLMIKNGNNKAIMDEEMV